MEIHLNPGDPKGDEALRLLLRLAAANHYRGVSDPEATKVLRTLAGDEVLSAWFVVLSGALVSAYAQSVVEHDGGDFAEALLSIEKALEGPLRGETS